MPEFTTSICKTKTIFRPSCYVPKAKLMTYDTEVHIALPREQVIALFDSTENMYKWQDGLQSCDHLEGTPGEEGARSRMLFTTRRGPLEMIEHIELRKFPEEFAATYEAKGVRNVVHNYFEEAGPSETRWRMHNTFRFRGMMVLMAPFMKGMFKSNTLLNMERFKSFAESQKKNSYI